MSKYAEALDELIARVVLMGVGEGAFVVLNAVEAACERQWGLDIYGNSMPSGWLVECHNLPHGTREVVMDNTVRALRCRFPRVHWEHSTTLDYLVLMERASSFEGRLNAPQILWVVENFLLRFYGDFGPQGSGRSSRADGNASSAGV